MDKIENFIKELKAEMHWDDDILSYDPKAKIVTSKYGFTTYSSNLTGYNYAFQVKSVMDLLEKTGQFR